MHIQQLQQLQEEVQAKDEQIEARGNIILQQQNAITLMNSQLEDLARQVEVSGSIFHLHTLLSASFLRYKISTLKSCRKRFVRKMNLV